MHDACCVSPVSGLRASKSIIWATLGQSLRAQTSSTPLVILRVMFGLLMFVSTVRFVANGWVDAFYLQPTVHFTYLGFGWVRPLPGPGLYLVYGTIALLSLMIAAGLWYRVSIIGFFLLFTYTELLDKTYYLNHYYFISSLSFLLIWLPKPTVARTVPAWAIAAVRLQLTLVYFFVGIAKLNTDWLLHAMPLRIWLAGHTDFPLIGHFFDYAWAAYAMSWAGALYDLTIPFLLLNRHTRPVAYLAVIAFHVMTGMLFPIGMFPAIMIACTLVFFEPNDFVWVKETISRQGAKLQRQRRAWARYPMLRRRVRFHRHTLFSQTTATYQNLGGLCAFARTAIILLFFLFQLAMPLRHWLYPGNRLWTEEGYRFAWHVMLAEKTGHVTFTAVDQAGHEWTLYPSDYLTYQQEKQMSFQPDMILEFAHFLEREMQTKGIADIAVYAEAYVSLNGRPSQLLLDPSVDLTTQTHTLAPKAWILPLQE